jgi:hypothetical protein
VLLNPKKAKLYISDVAKELKISESLVGDVVSYYWQEVRKNLSSLSHSRVHVTNLGDFTIKHWKIDDKILMLEQWEENNRQKGMQQMTARFKTAESLFELKNIKKIIEEEGQRKEFIKLHKITSNEPKRKRNKNLESKGADIGGSE